MPFKEVIARNLSGLILSFSCFSLHICTKGAGNVRREFSLSIVIALLLALTVATAVWADELLTDGDALVPVVDTPSLDLGEV